MNVEELIKFEEEIASIYEDGNIKAPVHLRTGNESQLVDIFKDVDVEDYVFSTWASHLHCLLKGVPAEDVKKDILQGRSITLHYPNHNVFSSAIVGGIAPIATGTAKAINMRQGSNRVYCFLGDMGFQTGIANESIRYSIGHDLPVTWVIEDNGVSVGTDTKETCGVSTYDLYLSINELLKTYSCKNTEIVYYSYKNTYPHSGTGVFVEF